MHASDTSKSTPSPHPASPPSTPEVFEAAAHSVLSWQYEYFRFVARSTLMLSQLPMAAATQFWPTATAAAVAGERPRTASAAPPALVAPPVATPVATHVATPAATHAARSAANAAKPFSPTSSPASSSTGPVHIFWPVPVGLSGVATISGIEDTLNDQFFEPRPHRTDETERDVSTLWHRSNEFTAPSGGRSLSDDLPPKRQAA